jgi:hypothetical protein
MAQKEKWTASLSVFILTEHNPGRLMTFHGTTLSATLIPRFLLLLLFNCNKSNRAIAVKK